jgi:hypothetical protein
MNRPDYCNVSNGIAGRVGLLAYDQMSPHRGEHVRPQLRWIALTARGKFNDMLGDQFAPCLLMWCDLQVATNSIEGGRHG